MKDKNLLKVWVVAAVWASLCCITPVLALLLWVGGIASTFDRIQPFRPYIIWFTVLVLLYLWWKFLNKKYGKQEIDCDCEEDANFYSTWWFMILITFIAGALLLFPYYAQVFAQWWSTTSAIVSASEVTETFSVEGMTCGGCEALAKWTLSNYAWISKVDASYIDGEVTVNFDPSQISLEDIKVNLLKDTGYKAIE